MFTDMTWVQSVVDAVTGGFTLLTTAPVSYFVILGLASALVGIIKKAIK